MQNMKIDFSKKVGPVKPMHAVNNGPLGKSVRATDNFDLYAAAGFPYARNHDASFCQGYGGEDTVDVHRIFKDFDMDENDPASYLFGPTDTYVKNTFDAGTKVFYRLGASIEHYKKCGTYPPKDFAKWARICEHIIRHYTEGWADGFNYDIEYWEIWNEPECVNADGSNPCWQGTNEQFIELYTVTAKHLKKCFPHLKIGGPAFTGPWRNKFKRDFLKNVKENNVPLDFYSYHCYAATPIGIYEAVIEGEKALAEYGLEGTETILNEWNYVKGWLGDDWKATLEGEQGLLGSAFTAAAMSLCQYSSLGMLMYYEARPCAMSGIFVTDMPWKTRKAYYSFKMFNELYKLGTAVEISGDSKTIFGCAAANDEKCAVMFSHFSADENATPETVKVDMSGFSCENGVKAQYYLIDEEHNLELVKEEMLTGDSFAATVELPLYSSCLIMLEKN